MLVTSSLRAVVQRLRVPLGLCWLIMGGPGSAQVVDQAHTEEKRASVYHVSSSVVSIDAIVTDKKNRPVLNLSPGDLTVYEDGVPQDVDLFSVHRGSSSSSQRFSAARGTSAAPPPEISSRQLPNLTIILLDYSTTKFENQKLVQEASLKYVQQKLQPNDEMAVFVLGGGLRFLTDFTSDKQRLVGALSTRDVMGTALTAERQSLTTGIDAGLSGRVPSGNDSTASVGLAAGPGASVDSAALTAAGSASADAQLAQRISALFHVLRTSLDDQQTRGVLTAIRAIAQGVKQIEGRKTLVLFSEGFVVGEAIEPELHAVVSEANRSHLAVYCLDTHGLETSAIKNELLHGDELTASALAGKKNRTQATGGETIFDRTLAAGRDMAESSLRYLSSATGGFYVRNTNDMETGLLRLDDEIRSYYLITYRSKNPKLDGQFRQIRVEARPPGLTVRARNGYYAIPNDFEFLTPEEYQLVNLARTAVPSQRLPLFARVGGFQDQGGQYRVLVILEIPTRSIQFTKNAQRHSAQLEILGIVRDSAGNFAARFGGPVHLSLTEPEYKVLTRGNVSFLNTLQLSAGKAYAFEVAVKDLSSGMSSDRNLGMLLRESVPGLTLSSILLAKEVDKAPNAGSGFLSIEGAKILPTAQCEFHNGDNLIFYFDIYHPQLQSQKTDVAVDLTLLRNGQLVNITLPRYELTQALAEPIPHLTLSRYIQLAGLQAGAYSLVFQVKDVVANKVESAQAAFTVVN